MPGGLLCAEWIGPLRVSGRIVRTEVAMGWHGGQERSPILVLVLERWIDLRILLRVSRLYLIHRLSIGGEGKIVARERKRESLIFLFDANNLCLLIFRPSISISRFLLPLRKYRIAIGDGIDFKSCGIFSKMIGSNNDSNTMLTRFIVNSAEIGQKSRDIYIFCARSKLIFVGKYVYRQCIDKTVKLSPLLTIYLSPREYIDLSIHPFSLDYDIFLRYNKNIIKRKGEKKKKKEERNG